MNRFWTERQSIPRVRRRRPWSRASLVVAGALAFGAVAAACSSSSSPSSPSSTTAAQAAKGGGGAKVTLVSTTDNATLGKVLVNKTGFTLYTLAGNAPCDTACAAVWPPLLVPAGTTPDLSGVAGLGTVSVSGGEQVTYQGMRLYTFVGDKSAGQAKGQGLTDTWGTWSAATTQASATPTTGATTTTAGGGGGGVGF